MASVTLDAARRVDAAPADWLIGGGEMGKHIRSMDWSDTPLGPIHTWPQSLRTTVGLVLSSNFPISLVWGPGRVQIYNDGYWPICGGKHPHSMGQDFRVCWESPWPVVGEPFERALAGETSYLENQRMFLDRNGYLEETFFTFSFSPIRDETGDIAGLFHPVTETTAKMLSERRTRILRDAGARGGKATNGEEALTLTAQTLAEFELDLPFVLFYLFDREPRQARLVAFTGLPAGSRACPASWPLDGSSTCLWPLRELSEGGATLQIEQLERELSVLGVGPYPEPPKVALAMPIMFGDGVAVAGVMIAGVSSRLPLSESYRAFYDLLASSVTSSFVRAHAYEQERQRAEALAELDRAKTAFFSNVSHEFRTPLTLMLGPLEEELNERDAPLPAARHERLGLAHRNTLRLLKLVNTLLDFSRIEAGRIQAQYRPVELAQFTAELASVFRSAVEQAGLTLTVDCPPLGEPVYVDHDMWEKIVLNLLSNAFKHTFEGGIHVSLRKRDEQIELAVADTGVGIAESEQARLFERFHRVKGTKSRTHEGTGIGLALVHELAAAHGGQVRVESALGKGSKFVVSVRTGTAHLSPEHVVHAGERPAPTNQTTAYVAEALHWLPASASSLPPPASVHECVPAAPTSGSQPRLRIVLADDNQDMRHYVARLLSSRYDVVAVSDGAGALREVLANPPDLVLSDVMMPGLDGFGLIRELRRHDQSLTVPVILLSARAGEDAAVEGLEAGADDYLIKPFAARELLARVRTHLDLASLRRAWARELEQANRELEAFSYTVSHDLRAPLRAIDGFSKALLAHQGDRLDERGRSHLARVRAATARMSTLIDDLLELARVSRAEVKREPFELGELAWQVWAELARQQPERRVNIEIEPGMDVQADPRFVRVILENLLGNAWKFTRHSSGARVKVGRVPGAGVSAFYVQDNGAGFDMSYEDKLFQPFSRLHAHDEFEGTGVGLATVQRIVVRHGGRVWARGVPAEGAVFFFTLESRT